MASPLFTGPGSIRDPRERLAFVLTLLFAFPMAGLIGLVIHENIGVPTVALFIIIAMLYVTLARGRLIGSSVMIHEAQYPRVFAIVKDVCTRLDIAMPLIFVREDNYVPVAALGFGEPYSLVLSTHWIEHFEDDELAFAAGRELGHIAAGHTRFLSLLSVNGNENPLISLVFGGWLRSCSKTCDKVGLLACGSLDAAIRSIAIANFHSFGRHIDVQRFAEQAQEIAGDGVLRLGELLGSEPYATRRIGDMQRFAGTPSYEQARTWYTRDVSAEPPKLAAAVSAHVTRSDCAGILRRAWAIAIDSAVVFAALAVFYDAHGKSPLGPLGYFVTDKDLQQLAVHNWFIDSLAMFIKFAVSESLVITGLYLFLLVGIAGQSFGMMITGLRVVTTDFRSPGLLRSFWRYVLAVFLWPVVLCCLPFAWRIMLHDRLTGTRLIRAERIMARAAEVAQQA
ncbi:MAG TPA: RDD family protein [Candidatus Acidoferrales bacterium]|nr:RDD family protein [Candidatus Acidoferrales bacterium]